MIVKYANTFNAATTGELVFDDMYVDHTSRRVWNVQDWGGRPHLATEITRSHAAKWIAYRRVKDVLHRFTDQYSPITVPHLPVGEYAAADKIVLHGDLMSNSGYKSGETESGASWSEMRLSLDNYEDFHRNTECDEHGTDGLVCSDCGHRYESPCPTWCECSGFNFDKIDACEDCGKVYECVAGNCDCASKLEQCEVCGRDLGSGDTAWLCMDGGGFACGQHIVHDERPDELFTKVGAIRGEALPAFAWPGGDLIVYYTESNEVICADCANELDTSDPAVAADTDEELICGNCPHAQSEHRSEKAHRTDGNSDDVGPCQAQTVMETDTGAERIVGCGCERYYPPLCEGCNKPLDPALREWWASLNKKEVMA